MESSIVEKSMVLIEYLAGREAQPLSLIARAVGQTRPTAHRILGNLIGLGYVMRSGEGVYVLTNKLNRVAHDDISERLIAVAETSLSKLQAQTRETANLGMLSGLSVKYLRTLPSNYPLQRIVKAGEVDPFYCTALGRVLASFLPKERVMAMLAKVKPTKRSPRTEVDPKKLLRIILAAKTIGHAVEFDQTDLGVFCIAAPVSIDGNVVAAVSISGVTARLEQRSLQSLIRHVRRAGAVVSSELARSASR